MAFLSLPLRASLPSCSISTIFHGLLELSTALGARLRRLSATSLLGSRLACSAGRLRSAVVRASQLLVASVDPVWVLLIYFVSNSVVGFLLLRALPQRRAEGTVLGDLDLFFTSVSAATVSSMSTVEMEALSRGQLAVLIVLMLVGGVVFTSMIQLHLAKAWLLITPADDTGNDGDGDSSQIELGPPAVLPEADVEAAGAMLEVGAMDSNRELECRSINVLGMVVFWYNAVFLLLGSAAVFLYLACVPGAGGARDVLRKKGIPLLDFSVFLVVSSFTNCGFLPTNENMLPFRNNSGLLLLTVPLILAGNTLFPACLRTALWVTRGLAPKGRAELCDYLLNRTDGLRLGFHHLLGRSRCVQLVLTAAAFLAVQFVVFCCMNWSSAAVVGDLSAPEKVAAVLFESVNSRHAGESVFDLSSLSPALVALYVVMMYLPPYTTFSPAGDEEASSISSAGKLHEKKEKRKKGRWVRERLMFSPLSWIAVFVVLVCITERRKLAGDPLNFNVFTVVVEVVSAYGNVGLSTGYSCGRRLTEEDGGCKDRWQGFVGRWSDAGRLLLIAVMFFGSLEKFNNRRATAWKLS